MKLKNHKFHRSGDVLTIEAQINDKFREPRFVTIKVGAKREPGLDPLVQGTIDETSSLMGCLASIAWDMGWRPRGLEATLAAVVRKFKEPPLEG